ncbi:MAG: hypothetical protein AAGH87_04595 [Pseudomonadota bacterium]
MNLAQAAAIAFAFCLQAGHAPAGADELAAVNAPAPSPYAAPRRVSLTFEGRPLGALAPRAASTTQPAPSAAPAPRAEPAPRRTVRYLTPAEWARLQDQHRARSARD